jgi:hypothetical protein
LTDTWSAYRKLALRLQTEISSFESTRLPLSETEKKILKSLKKVLGDFGSNGGDDTVDKK